MKLEKIVFLLAFFCGINTSKSQSWPILKHYDENHISKVALPVGGIGTGTVSISGRGNLVDWEIMNRPGKGFSTVTPGNDAPFFAIHVESGEKTFTKGLMGPLLDYEYEHMEGRPVDHHGVPRFEKATFDAAALGKFHKSIKVTANVEGGPEYLYLQGTVVP